MAGSSAASTGFVWRGLAARQDTNQIQPDERSERRPIRRQRGGSHVCGDMLSEVFPEIGQREVDIASAG